jgi:hypothetical protein
MIETVVALLMFVGAEIKEHRIQHEGMAQCLRGKRTAERQYQPNVMYKCIKSKAELEKNIDGSLTIKKLILE